MGVTPDGNPLMLNPTVPLNPFRSFTVMMVEVPEFCRTFSVVDDADRVKLFAVAVVTAS